jgi:tetratricopeptide (TPR) repeat protein
MKKDFDRAIADYTLAIRLDPNDAAAHIGRGAAWFDKKEYDKAIADYSRAIDLDPNDPLAYFGRGLTWSIRKNYDRAIADYRQAIRLKPNLAFAYNNAVWLMATCPDERFRNGRKAVELATKANELTSWTDFGSLDTLAAAYAEAGDFESAIKYQTKAIELNPTAAEFVEGEKKRLELYKGHKPYREV